MGNIRLFISHSSKDQEIATGIVDLIETALVREDRILCTSHPNQQEYGYPKSDRMDVSEHLREHLSEASCVVALLTPYSLESGWCWFELGGAWARSTRTYPLIAGGVTQKHLPTALEGTLFGRLDDAQDLHRLLLNLSVRLTWDQRNMELATGDHELRDATEMGPQVVTINHLVKLVKKTTWPPPPAPESGWKPRV